MLGAKRTSIYLTLQHTLSQDSNMWKTNYHLIIVSNRHRYPCYALQPITVNPPTARESSLQPFKSAPETDSPFQSLRIFCPKSLEIDRHAVYRTHILPYPIPRCERNTYPTLALLSLSQHTYRLSESQTPTHIRYPLQLQPHQPPNPTPHISNKPSSFPYVPSHASSSILIHSLIHSPTRLKKAIPAHSMPGSFFLPSFSHTLPYVCADFCF